MNLVGDYYVEVAGRMITINPFDITPRHGIKINAKITQARIKNSDFGRLPPNEEESREDYLKRYAEFLKAEEDKNKGELASDYLTRSFEPAAFKDNLNYMCDCLNAILEAFDKPAVSYDDFTNTPLLLTNNFIARVCKKAKVPVEFVLDSE